MKEGYTFKNLPQYSTVRDKNFKAYCEKYGLTEEDLENKKNGAFDVDVRDDEPGGFSSRDLRKADDARQVKSSVGKENSGLIGDAGMKVGDVKEDSGFGVNGTFGNRNFQIHANVEKNDYVALKVYSLLNKTTVSSLVRKLVREFVGNMDLNAIFKQMDIN